MSKQEENDKYWIDKIDNICINLNVDPVAAKKSKESFLSIKQHYTLDGDPLHWIACALYVACRTSITPTVETGKALEGNCVSLTRLLRLCNISLIQFFNKIKNWMEMAAMSTDFRHRIERLERKFAVSTVLYRKFQPLFQEIFLGLTNDPIKPNAKMSKKQKLLPCTTNALFEFTWCLYISVKGEFHNSADDLVDMYHVLLACLDFVFANAFMARRTDLLNPTFKGLPADYHKEEFELPSKPPCIIATLCEIKEALPLEAATMKEYSWRPVLKTFYEKGILKGDSKNLLGVLDIGNFDVNLKSVNNLYETYVLSVGEFDERIFLGEHANDQIGTPNKVSGEEINRVIATFGASGRGTCPETPLTGRRYLAGRSEPLTPVSEATNSLAKLHSYLSQAKPCPSHELRALFTEGGVSEEMIESNLIEPCNAWSRQFSDGLRDSNCSNEIITLRCNMVTSLYYKVFEHILREEHRKKPQVSLKMILSQEQYRLSLYACCAEVAAHAYGLHSMRFPRVLRLFHLSAFHFYKIIELVVQAVVDKMSRDVIKHLNAIEEEVLESLVWTADSPLWERLASAGAVPAATHVYVHESPRRNIGGLQSPVSAAIDRFIHPNAEQAKKKLFQDNVKPGQSLLANSNVIMKADSDTTERAPSTPVQATSGETTPNATPKKANNSLVLFFRKFYSLAVVRMNDLCTRLKLTDEELKRKIWTCLEHSIMHQTKLLRDRHLDQILMCAVYVICKVSHNSSNQVERTFTEIMRCYRQRPLADNHVYRSVLIANDTEHGTPERGDLIKFYNKVYVQCMQSFALRFTGKNKEECPLSPLPSGRGGFGGGGATRVSERHQLYVKPLASPPAPSLRLVYRFSRSPAKDLQAINTMLATETSTAKRSISTERNEVVVKHGRLSAPAVNRKLQGLMSDRQAVWYVHTWNRQFLFNFQNGGGVQLDACFFCILLWGC